VYVKFENDCVRSTFDAELILASSSARRRQLMTEAGYQFRVIAPTLPEDHLHPQPPRMLAESLAYAKARSVADALDRGVVVGADTVVTLGDDVLGKAADADAVGRMLASLSGTTHEVITGLCVLNARRGERLIGAEVTRITLQRLTDAEIAAYVASGEGVGKAGGYAIQESGDRFVDTLDGSFTNVVGLPMPLLAEFLELMKRYIYRETRRAAARRPSKSRRTP